MEHYTYSPRPRRARRAPHRRSGAGMMQQWGDMYMDYVDEMGQMWQEALSPLAEMFAPTRERRRHRKPGHKHRRHKHGHHHHHHCDCGCHEHPWDDCHCLCCIGDADLVVYAHLGERRVVPIEIENHRRRERDIRLELSGWSSRGGRPAEVSAQLLPPTEFTLAPCSRREVLLVVNAVSASVEATLGQAVDAEQDERDEEAQAQREQEKERRRVPDVDDCEVAYADLRVEGCDIRPVRIALVLLPRDCDPYEIDCRCGCC